MSIKQIAASALLVLCMFLLSCKKFEYSPYQTKLTGDATENLNAVNLDHLMAKAATADDTVTILYSGDSQRFYDELEDLVRKTNTLTCVDFLLLSGDIADFGLLQEYIWIKERLAKLRVPYFCAVGNHDFVANKGDIFTRIFGEKNFSFVYKDYKFLFHDTNSREYDFNGAVPDIPWLSAQLQDSSARWFVGVSHVPPYNEDFDKKLERPYKELFAPKPEFILSLHGHLHGTSDSFYYDDHVRYMTSNSVEKKEAVLLKLIHGTIIKQMIPY